MEKNEEKLLEIGIIAVRCERSLVLTSFNRVDNYVTIKLSYTWIVNPEQSWVGVLLSWRTSLSTKYSWCCDDSE